MAQFRKRPVVIEAVQWTGENLAEVVRFAGNNVRLGVEPDGIVGLSLDRLEVFAVKEQTWVCCPIQHWVIRGVADEFYPCAPDVFDKTYDAVNEAVEA